MSDDIKQITHPNAVPLATPPFSHLLHQNQHGISGNTKKEDDHGFLHPSHQNQHPTSNNVKKEDNHVFLHPSCMTDHQRRIQDTQSLTTNNGIRIQPTASVRFPSVLIFFTEMNLLISLQDEDSYMSDDNTSESETSGVHGLYFNEDEQQAFKVEE